MEVCVPAGERLAEPVVEHSNEGAGYQAGDTTPVSAKAHPGVGDCETGRVRRPLPLLRVKSSTSTPAIASPASSGCRHGLFCACSTGLLSQPWSERCWAHKTRSVIMLMAGIGLFEIVLIEVYMGRYLLRPALIHCGPPFRRWGRQLHSLVRHRRHQRSRCLDTLPYWRWRGVLS